MANLDYKGIKELLGDELFGGGMSDDGTKVIVEFAFKDEDGDPVYKATWESKRTERVIWYCTHYYHKDGTVEEIFDRELVEQ